MDGIKCPIVKSDSVCYWKDMWQKLDRMRQLWQLCDVSLVTADERMFMAHSPVLAASSNTLHDMLIRQNQSATNEETQKKVFLKNVNSDVLEVTLNFIYGITPLNRMAFEMLQVGAKELGIMGAYEYCCDQLKNLAVETSGSKGEDKGFPSTMRREKNVMSYEWQLDEPTSGLVGVEGQKCEFASSASQSTYRVGDAEESGLDAAHSQGVNSIACWPEPPLALDGKAIVDDMTVSVSSSTALDVENSCQLNVMPSDDIHTEMFTQMSLGDLTAGIKCPHIKGIIGENNPMDSFLLQNDLVDNETTFKQTGLQAEESDSFDETPTLEEHGIEFAAAVPVPLKKRKRSPSSSSLRIISTGDDDRRPTSSPSHQSFSRRIRKSSEDQGSEDFQNFLERNHAPLSSKDSSRHNSNLDLLNSFISSNCLNPSSCTAAPIQEAAQRNYTKTLTFSLLDEGGALLKPQNVPTNDIECVQLVHDSEQLLKESVYLEESLPGCKSPFQSCTSSQKQSVQTNSIRVVPVDDLPPSHFSFSVKNSLVSDLSDNLLVTEIPNSSGSFLSINNSRAADASNSLQVLGSVWQDGFASLKPGFAVPSNVFNNVGKKLNWESASMLEPVCSRAPRFNEEVTSSLEPMAELDLTPSCEQKVFTSLVNAFPKHGTSRPQPHGVISSSKGVDSSAVSMHEKQILCFSAFGPCQGTAPNTMTRNQPIEMCPSVGDVVSIAAATVQSSDESSSLATVSRIIQEGYVSSSPEAKGSSDPLLSNIGKYLCDLCDKSFKNMSQLNGHRRRIHLQKKTEELGSTDDKSSSASTLHCQYCQESFKSSYKLQTHQLKVHCKGKLFSCQDCSFRSPRKKDVQAHMLSQHGRAPFGVKVYSCSSCNYKCIDRNRFEEHEAKHTGITSHRCPLCSRAYTTKRGMRTHIKYHSEERPHKCNICGAAFKVTSKLSDHMKLIHIQKGVKPYKCGYCDHATALRGNCNQHIRKNHPGQPLFVIDKFASQRKCVKDYDYAGIAGEGIEEHGDLKAAAAKVGVQSSKMVVL